MVQVELKGLSFLPGCGVLAACLPLRSPQRAFLCPWPADNLVHDPSPPFFSPTPPGIDHTVSGGRQVQVVFLLVLFVSRNFLVCPIVPSSCHAPSPISLGVSICPCLLYVTEWVGLPCLQHNPHVIPSPSSAPALHAQPPAHPPVWAASEEP